MENSCSFCDVETIEKQEIAVVGTVRILYPRRPVIPMNALIVPVRCVEHLQELTEDEILDVFSAVKKLNSSFNDLYGTTAYNLFVNDGVSAGQHIPHVHFHFYGRSENEEINPFDILNDKARYKARESMEEAEYNQYVEEIRNSL